MCDIYIKRVYMYFYNSSIFYTYILLLSYIYYIALRDNHAAVTVQFKSIKCIIGIYIKYCNITCIRV